MPSVLPAVRLALLPLLVVAAWAAAADPSETCPSKSLAPPTIDIGPLYGGGTADPAARAAVIRAIGEASRRWGFFTVVNHGVPGPTTASLLDAMKRFFAQPAEQKRAVKRTAANSRGFADDELTKQRLDMKQIFDCGHEPRPDLPANDPLNHVMDGYNQVRAHGSEKMYDPHGELGTHAHVCVCVWCAPLVAVAGRVRARRESLLRVLRRGRSGDWHDLSLFG